MSRFKKIFLVQFILFLLLTPFIDTASSTEISISRPTSYWFAPEFEANGDVKISRNIIPLSPSRPGWIEYIFEVQTPGWYKFTAVTDRPFFTTTIYLTSPSGSNFDFGPRFAWSNGISNIGEVWLNSGFHHIKFLDYHWTGLPLITSLSFNKIDNPSTELRILNLMEKSMPVGNCRSAVVKIQSLSNTVTVIAQYKTIGLVERRSFQVSINQPLTNFSLPLICEREGDWSVELKIIGKNAKNGQNQKLNYAVFRNKKFKPSIRLGEIVDQINLRERAPDFVSDITHIRNLNGIEYRETGDVGLQPYSRGKIDRQPSWMAYKIKNLSPGSPYYIELDIPDDQQRGFIVALRQGNSRMYPQSFGFNTGQELPLTHTYIKERLLFWATDSAVSVVLLPNLSGTTAATASITIFKAIESVDLDRTETTPNREFAIWTEEGTSFLDGVGMTDRDDKLWAEFDRWTRSMRSQGATLLLPTIVGYASQFYTSLVAPTFSKPDDEKMSALLLSSESYGLSVVPQINPRADELTWVNNISSLKDRLLLSATGENNLFQHDGTRNYPPYYNIFDPDVKSFYINLILEIANNYKKYKSFKGLSIRIADWANPALNNLVSLDWGYNPEIIRAFFGDSNLKLPLSEELLRDESFDAKKWSSLLKDNYRDQWISWRCKKMADLFVEISSKLQLVRPDLYLALSLTQFGSRPFPTEQNLREAGIDVSLLNGVAGLKVVNSELQYGRREADLQWGLKTATLFEDTSILTLYGNLQNPFLLFPKHYIEAIGEIAPAELLGLPQVNPRPWISSSLNPLGNVAMRRYSVPLGLTDSFWLGDGGNANVFISQHVKDFAEKFTNLPLTPFFRVTTANKGIAVWQAPGWVYLVNLENRDAQIEIVLDKSVRWTDIPRDSSKSQNDGRVINFQLGAYGLSVFKIEDAKIVSVITN